MENSRCEKAVEKKHNGYNCAQAVACSFCKEASMDEDTLKKSHRDSVQALALWPVHAEQSPVLQL